MGALRLWEDLTSKRGRNKQRREGEPGSLDLMAPPQKDGCPKSVGEKKRSTDGGGESPLTGTGAYANPR